MKYGIQKNFLTDKMVDSYISVRQTGISLTLGSWCGRTAGSVVGRGYRKMLRHPVDRRELEGGGRE